MCRETAAKELRTFIHVERLRSRAIQLLERPELLDQGLFGICSSMCVLYPVIVHSPPLFVSYLKDSVFGRHSFLVYELLKYYEAKMRLNLQDRIDQVETLLGQGGSFDEDGIRKIATYIAGKHDYSLDYIMGRILIQIMHADISEGREIYEQSKKWSKKWSRYFADRNRNWAIEQGDFAVLTEGVHYMCRKVFGLTTCTVAGESFAHKIQFINNAFDGNPRSFVIVAINGFSDLAVEAGKRKIVGKSFVPRPNTPEYSHWVAFTKKVEDQAYYYVFHFFSWGQIYKVRISKAVAGSYMVDLVYGSF